MERDDRAEPAGRVVAEDDLLMLGGEFEDVGHGATFWSEPRGVGGRSVRGVPPVLDHRCGEDSRVGQGYCDNISTTAYEAPNVASATTRQSMTRSAAGRAGPRGAGVGRIDRGAA